MTMAALAGETALGREFGEHRDRSPALSAVVDHYGLADPARLRDDAHDNTEEQLRALDGIAAQFFDAVPPASAGPAPAGRPGRAAVPDHARRQRPPHRPAPERTAT
jgi:hypothetical protein